jgi:hypothetical protein
MLLLLNLANRIINLFHHFRRRRVFSKTLEHDQYVELSSINMIGVISKQVITRSRRRKPLDFDTKQNRSLSSDPFVFAIPLESCYHQLTNKYIAYRYRRFPARHRHIHKHKIQQFSKTIK